MSEAGIAFMMSESMRQELRSFGVSDDVIHEMTPEDAHNRLKAEREAAQTHPIPDRAQLARFVNALFRYADEDTYASLRSFYDDGEGVAGTEAVAIGPDLEVLTEAALAGAKRAAEHSRRVVFCPPVATFHSQTSATEADLANGLTLTVECDERPSAARTKLEDFLGPATVVAASGGLWADPETGEVQDKLHLHWRLTEPTRDDADHAKLKRARQLAAKYAGGDLTSGPPVHPIRWPGSVHRKGKARLARIVAGHDSAEIELRDALERLEQACPDEERARDPQAHPGSISAALNIGRNEKTADLQDIAAALYVIPNDGLDWESWNRVGMATWLASSGQSFASFDAWSRKAEKYDAARTAERWNHYATSPPSQIGAGTLFRMAADAAPGWRKPSDGARDQKRESDASQSGGNAGSQNEQAQKRAAPRFDFSSLCLTLDDWFSRDLPPPDYLLGDWLSTTSRAMMVAATGLGKTNIGMAMASAIAAGEAFLHWQGRRWARVLYVDGEMSQRLYRSRMDDATRRLGARPAGLFYLSKEQAEAMQPLNAAEGQAFIDQLIDHIGGADLVVFDNVMSLISGDMKDEEGWSNTLPWAKTLTRRGIGQLWIHHTGHDETRSYGTKTREWQLDTVLLLEKLERPNADIAFTLSFRKARERTPANRSDFESVGVMLDGDAWKVEGTARAKSKVAPQAELFHKALLDALSAAGEKRRDSANIPSVLTTQWKDECVRLGLIERDEKGQIGRRETVLFNKYKLALQGASWTATNGAFSWSIRHL